MGEKVIVLEPGDEQAQKIAKAMGSRMASDILQLLGEGQQSLTDITGRLAIPMTTAKYHVENLLGAGLISVTETKYSVKGREVKLYSLTNQLLIVAPRQSGVRSLLLKYASLFGIVAFGSMLIAILSPTPGPGSIVGSSLNAAPSPAVQETGGTFARAVSDGIAANVTRAPELMITGSKGVYEGGIANLSPAPHAMVALPQVPADAGASALPFMPDAALAFFLGGAMVILVLLCCEACLRKRR